MICPEEEIILRYLDNELTEEDTGRFELHLSECEKCRNELDRMAENIALIKRDIKQLEPESINVPDYPFSKTLKILSLGKVSGAKKMLKRIILPAAALIMVVLIAYNTFKDSEIDQDYMEAIMKAEEDILIPDSNSWWTERRMFIAIIDKDTKTMEKIITSKNSDNIISETIKY
ncbi:MAG: hypothetical protein GY863_01620 [bacterium]|nr:hypothetical protein [bacterium]